MYKNFQLTPFGKASTEFAVEVKVQRIGNLLLLSFSLYDIQQEVFWPEPSQIMRQDFLWESTCFEAFIGSPNRTEYFEFNLSPSLSWNLYQFKNYRSPKTLPPPHANESGVINVQVIDRTLHIILSLGAMNLAEQEIQLGLAAVIKTEDSLHYLALEHPRREPDFHDSRYWTIKLPPYEEFHDSHGQ
ncbi:DOMON-like domain-containing protein [Aquirhabdus parva]|uniref:DOMON-like domain-containing protein n=1 Tax=Aquirhabdus parva TaxID=2283318 RepID=A0A345P7C1_9GAMM|nr:DOMON-like domain-containing protein [Aquirhabdus parva]AXI03180.1 hypothetical protein HYN46_10235 [Aquirhabdus parva]